MAAPWLLLQLADSAFPTGGFSHSAGLEAALAWGELRDGPALRRFVEGVLWQAGHGALPFLGAAHRGADLDDLDRRCDAFLTPQVTNRASRTQGRTLVATAARVFPDVEALAARHEGVRSRTLLAHHAPMFGATLAALEVSLPDTRILFLHQALRGVCSAAIRLGLVGPHEAQGLQHEVAPTLDAVLERCAALPLTAVCQPAPLQEILAGTQDRLYSRLFQS